MLKTFLLLFDRFIINFFSVYVMIFILVYDKVLKIGVKIPNYVYSVVLLSTVNSELSKSQVTFKPNRLNKFFKCNALL